MTTAIPIGYRLTEIAGVVLTPIREVGEHDGLPLWQVKHFLSFGEREATLIAVANHETRTWIGFIDLRSGVAEPIFSCMKDLRALAKRHPEISTERVTWIHRVHISRAFRQRGLGVSMYVASVYAAYRNREVLAAGRCMGDQTLAAAKRVWRSERFLATVDVSGFIATVKKTQP